MRRSKLLIFAFLASSTFFLSCSSSSVADEDNLYQVNPEGVDVKDIDRPPKNG